jgi:NADH-quinone oxidoreductase subunit G
MEINKYWLCDEGRFNFHYVNDESRIVQPMGQQSGQLAALDCGASIDQAKKALAGKKVTVLVGSDLTQEEAALLQQFVPQHFKGAEVFHFGTPGIRSTQDDAPADRILKRKSKTSNLNGLEKLGYKGFEKLASGTQAVLIIRGGRAVLPELKGVEKVGIGVFMGPQAEGFAAVLPGITFTEKDGTIFNYEGREQKFRRAIMPRGQSKPLSEILMMWANRKNTSGAA